MPAPGLRCSAYGLDRAFGPARRLQFLLSLMALTVGVLVEALLLRSWRRPARIEFRRILAQALVGSLPATVFVAALLGLGMVYQALYWLRVRARKARRQILVAVLLRELVPILVGIILLGRSGSSILTELGNLLQAGSSMPCRRRASTRSISWSCRAASRSRSHPTPWASCSSW